MLCQQSVNKISKDKPKGKGYINMEKTVRNKEILLGLTALVCFIQEGTAFSTSPTSSSSCVSSTANISCNFSLGATESIIGTRIWFFGVNKIAESNGTTLTPVINYSSRLTAYGTHGISLSNLVAADNGIYTYVIILLPSGNPFTATATLSVQVAPLAPPTGCLVIATQSWNNVTCTVNTSSGYCGTPALNTYWVNFTTTFSELDCTAGGMYQCCATSASLTCYSGSPNDFCILYNCRSTSTNTVATTTISMTSSNAQTVSTQTSSVSTLRSSDTQTFPVIPVVIGVAVFNLLIVIIIICRCCYLSRHKKEIRTKQQYESKLEVTKNSTIPEDGTPNPAYVLHQF